MHTITYAFLVLLVSIGLNERTAVDRQALLALVLIVAGVKVLGARMGGFTNRESMRVGVGMISRGEVGLIVANVWVNAGLIKTELFSIVTLIVLLPVSYALWWRPLRRGDTSCLT
jgi:Kef-type K+ transport system membrane component KefB